MALTPDQRRRLYEALRHTYEPTAFAQLVESALGWPLHALAPDAAIFPAAVIQVIDWCETNDRLSDLLSHALDHDVFKQSPKIADRAFWDLSPRPRPTGPVPLERPARVEHFTGREQELGQLLADLMPGKVVTLSGPGGIGKTALAAQALWALAPGGDPPATFPDGIIFYSFYGGPSVLAAMEYIADVCGVEKGGSPSTRAQRALAARTAQVVLDGAEQADDLPALLDLRGNCGVLVTTRVHGGTDVEPLSAGEAASLLRSWAGKRAGEGTEADKAVARICELVGNLPLAVRLAGAYMAGCGVNAGEYLSWLEKATWEALHQGEHQRDSVTLLLDRSVAALNERARAALGVVGVLALQPFDAEWIASALDIDAGAAPLVLGELIKLSLLQRAEDGTYTVTHALVHTYARERLAPDAGTVSRLVKFTLARVKVLWETDKRDFAALGRLRPHAVGLVDACAQRESWKEVNTLAWVLQDYLGVQGFNAERIQVLIQGLGAARLLQEHWDEGAHLAHLGNCSNDLSQFSEALSFYQQALAIFQAIGDRQGEANALASMGNVLDELGASSESFDQYLHALSIHREIGDRLGEANDLNNLAIGYRKLGDIEAAIAHHQQALTIWEEIGDKRGKCSDLNNLGLSHSALGRIEVSIRFFEQALVIDRELGNRHGEGRRLGNLGNAYLRLGNIDQAIALLARSLTIRRSIGDLRGAAIDLANLGLAHQKLGNVEATRCCWQEALRIFTEIKSPRAERMSGWLATLDEADASNPTQPP